MTSTRPTSTSGLTRRKLCAAIGSGVFLGATQLTRRANAQTKTTSLAWTPGPSAPQVALAIDRKLWAEAGLDVKVVSFPSGREALEALLGGQVDFAILAELPVVTGTMRNQSFGVLSVLSRFRANRLIINGASGAKDIAGLAGRKVGTTLGTNMHFLADLVMGQAGLKAELVNIAPPDIVSALARQDIDAAFMFDNFFAQARRVLADRYVEVITPQYATNMLIAGTTDVIEKRPDIARTMLGSLVRAEAFIANGDDARAAVSRSVGGTVTADALRAQWESYDFAMKLDPALLDLMLAQGQWLARRGLVKTEPTAELFRSRVKEVPLRAVAAEKVTIS